MLFEKPLYKCKVGNKTYTVDVTLSAPPQNTASSIVRDLLNYFQKESVKTICDLGTGRLRNIRPFLEKGFTVYAVEYKEQFENYPKNKEKLTTLQNKFKEQFKRLIFPSEFRASTVIFDAILLIHVTHIVPFPKHRNYIIQYCSEKLKKGGLLFWTTPYGDTHMKRLCNDQYKYRDGWILRPQNKKQTFYTEFRVPQIDKMVLKHGFEFIDRLEFYKNPARMYRKK